MKKDTKKNAKRNDVKVTEKDIQFQKELQARIFIHKMAILGGAIMNDYINSHKFYGDENGINISDFILKQQADEYSNIIMQKALENGTFDSMYERAWQETVKIMPEYTNVME